MSVVQSNAGVLMIIVAEAFFSIKAVTGLFDYCKMCKCEEINSYGCVAPEVPSTNLSFKCEDRQHIICRFPNDWNPYPCTLNTVDPYGGRIKILGALNYWRNKTAMGDMEGLPAASNMMRLEWDHELQVMAVKTLMLCVEYDNPESPDKCRDSPRFPVAVFRAKGSNTDFRSMVDTAVSRDKEHINKGLLTTSCDQWGKLFGGMFFQKLIWAESRFVGCAYAEKIAKQNNILLACLLGPAGKGSWGYSLAPGQEAYKAGAPRSACPDGSFPDRLYAGLCRSNESRGLPPGACPPMPHGLEKKQLFTNLLFLLLAPFIIYFVLAMRGNVF